MSMLDLRPRARADPADQLADPLCGLIGHPILGALPGLDVDLRR